MATTATTVDADELNLLLAHDPATPAYRAYPVDLADRTDAPDALDTLRDLRRDGALTLIGIEFEDPQESGNQLVLASDDLAAVTLATAGDAIPATAVLDRITDLEHIAVTEPLV